MRDIKFRAYDKFAEKMMDDEDIGILPSNDTIGTTSYGNVTLINVSNEHYVIMQYTGLKDKNGVEIYESDIVEYRSKSGVVFMRFGCWFVELQRELGYYNNSVEIIGNRYENPELIE